MIENIKYFFKARNLRNIKNLFIYAKKLDTYDEENEIFINQFKNVVDEVQIEKPMNWSGAEDRQLLKETYTDEQISQAISHYVPQVCSYPFTTLCINPDGSVVVCCVDWSRRTYVGNVHEQTLKEIWNGKLLKNIRKLHLDKKRCYIESCKNCMQLPLHKDDNLDDVDSSILL